MNKKIVYSWVGLLGLLILVVVITFVAGNNDKVDVSNSKAEEFMSEESTTEKTEIDVPTRVPESEVETETYPETAVIGDGSTIDFGYTRYSYEIEEYSVDIVNTPPTIQMEDGSEGGSVVRVGDKGRPTKYKRQTDKKYTKEDMDLIYDSYVGSMQKETRNLFGNDEPMQLMTEFLETCVSRGDKVGVMDFQTGQNTDGFYAIFGSEGIYYHIKLVEDEGSYAVINYASSQWSGRSGLSTFEEMDAGE